MTTRRQRGYDTERHLANYLSTRGWPYAERTRSVGTDVIGTPGLLWEVKARRAFSPLAWLRQARNHGPGLPIAIIRPDGAGPMTIGQWAAMMTLDDLITLLHEAGYGADRERTQP